MKKIFIGISAFAMIACLSMTACSAPDKNYGGMDDNISTVIPDISEDGPSYEYNSVVENGFKNVSEESSSYFSLDRNTANYSHIRRQINNGGTIFPDSVRIEEMINYFDYSYPAPEEKAVNVSCYLSDCPWNSENKLLLAGIKTAEYNIKTQSANYVFLIDVSGSMSGADRIDLAKYGLENLTDSLSVNDTVSIVTYASGINTVLDGENCTTSGKNQIKSKLKSLRAYGATNGEGGLQNAYALAQKHYIEGGNNRVILISDGDFNVGISNTDRLKELIQEKAESGVYLSVIGVGMGNMRDTVLETLALCGNGNYAYLDSKTEADKVFGKDLNGILKTVAKDAKAGITFTENVEKYRLIGYDTKIISEDDFNNVDTDAGELGSNLCVSALYEIKLADGANGKLADVNILYKDVREGETVDAASCEVMIASPSSDDLRFISCVAEFGLILRQSAYRENASLANVIARLNDLSEYIYGDPYKKEFTQLAGKVSESNYYNRTSG